jgi:murein DD-endopeptidase MepM/ murein hydrolase activator NlpD
MTSTTDRDLLLAGAGAALLYHMLNTSPPWGTGWQWPIPDLLVTPSDASTRIRAAISQEFRRGAGRSSHYGVDLMYRSGDAAWSIPGVDGVELAAGWFAPPGTPIVAARSGTIWSVDKTARGFAVVVDHGPPWATFYQHLDQVSPGIVRGTPIAAGHQLGTMGADPTDPQRVRHLHFACWLRGAGDSASVDPSAAMTTWPRWTWTP